MQPLELLRYRVQWNCTTIAVMLLQTWLFPRALTMRAAEPYWRMLELSSAWNKASSCYILDHSYMEVWTFLVEHVFC